MCVRDFKKVESGRFLIRYCEQDFCCPPGGEMSL